MIKGLLFLSFTVNFFFPVSLPFYGEERAKVSTIGLIPVLNYFYCLNVVLNLVDN